RMTQIAGRLGALVVRVEAQWGEAIETELVLDAIKAHPNARAVGLVHAETSTGVQQPIDEIASVIRDDNALLIVDAVASLGGLELHTDQSGIDICYSATQKCLGIPPGLAPITFSKKAVQVIEDRTNPIGSWYLDASMIRQYWGTERVYHHTAPISMIYGLAEGLRVLKEEGLEDRWARHLEVGKRLQHELIARGFTLFAAEGYRLPQLTSMLVPEGFDAKTARSRLLDEFGIEVGGGLGDFSETMLRVGLMGEGARHEYVDRLLEALDRIF
ncbi:MAG: aminotransferase class V-fold PLP-dependent enzyme, partial [Actinobacteria bacterium]|nr:aminotransferase class V-fold PLP-dependent enzyme [Actinomycetota bacterium]